MKENNDYKVWQPIALACMLGIGMLIGSSLNEKVTQIIVNEQPSEHLSKLNRVGQILRYVDARYVDSIDLENLSMDAIEAIFQNLDPHSFFIPSTEVSEINHEMSGNFNGVGIKFSMYDDTLSVLSVLPDGPADKAGIRPGDRLLRIDTQSIAGSKMTYEQLQDLFLGDTGSKVEVLVDRYSESDSVYTMYRDKLNHPAITSAIELDSQTIYLDVRKFTSNVFAEFVDSLKKYEADEKSKYLILDLRGNPGGYLQEAIKMLSQMVDKRGLPLVKTIGYRTENKTYKTQGHKIFNFEQIAVLVNEYSASASEIIAGALQDYDLATIIGRRSFGKGLVQDQYQLSDGSAIRLTVARYYTPSGRLIQKSYKSDSSYRAYRNDIMHRWESGELREESAIPILDSTKYYTRNGRIIYGGEGIVPDLFIPIDSMRFNKEKHTYFNKMRACSFAYARKHNVFTNGRIPEFDYTRMSRIFNKCLGNNHVSLRASERQSLKDEFMRGLIFAKAGEKAARKFMLLRDPFIKKAMKFKQNALQVSNEKQKAD